MDRGKGHNFHCASCKIPFMNMNEVAMHIKRFHGNELSAALDRFNSVPTSRAIAQEIQENNDKIAHEESVSSHESTQKREKTDLEKLLATTEELDTCGQVDLGEEVPEFSGNSETSSLHPQNVVEKEIESSDEGDIASSTGDRPVIQYSDLQDDMVVIKILKDENIITEDLLKLYEDDEVIGKGLQTDQQVYKTPEPEEIVQSGSILKSCLRVTKTETKEKGDKTSCVSIFEADLEKSRKNNGIYNKTVPIEPIPAPKFPESELQNPHTCTSSSAYRASTSKKTVGDDMYIPASKRRKVEFMDSDSEGEYVVMETEEEDDTEKREIEDKKIRDLLTDKFGPRENLTIDPQFEDMWRKSFQRKCWDSDKLSDVIDAHCWNGNH